MTHNCSRRATWVKALLEKAKDLGYLEGLVVGDGSCYYKEKAREYQIYFWTSKAENLEIFLNVARSLGFNPIPYCYPHRLRKFPNGSTCSSPYYQVVINSKALYTKLRPCKGPDFHWTIPVFKSEEEKVGFLQGLFDAEGSPYIDSRQGQPHLSMFSKHLNNLKQVQNQLIEFDIHSRIYIHRKTREGTPYGYLLYINRHRDLNLFSQKIGFRFPAKMKVPLADIEITT